MLILHTYLGIGPDHAVLLFLYNSGARADEAAGLLIGNLHLKGSPPVLCAAVAAVARLQPHYEASLRERGREQLLAMPPPPTREVWESDERPPAMFGVRRPWQAPKRAIATEA